MTQVRKLTAVAKAKVARPTFAKIKIAKMPSFKFSVVKKPTLYATNLKLNGGGIVKVEAKRKVNDYGNIVPKPNTEAKTNDGKWSCSIHKWTGEIHTKEPVILNNNFSKLYPGAIYKYQNIANGSYTTLPYKRKPITITIDANNFKKAMVKIENPSMATVMAAKNQIVNSQTGRGGSRSFGQKFHVLSEEDLFIRTGGSGYFLGFGGSHQVSYESSSKSNKYFLEMYQAYFTISVDDTVHEPSDFFVLKSEKPNDPDAVQESVLDPNWVYVDSVTYGRMLQVMFESDQSFESVGIDIEAHANFLVAGGQGNFSLEQKSVLSKTSVKVVAIGGDPVYTGQLLNSGDFNELKSRIDTYFSGTKDEMPIAYTLRTLDQESVGATMITEFTSRQCAPVATKYAVVWKNIFCKQDDDGSGGEEIRAMARIRAWKGNGQDILDVDKINDAIIKMDKMTNGIPLPWTFAKGSDNNPINMRAGDFQNFDRKIVFPIPLGDTNAKIGIRADILEYDSPDANDNFTDALWEKKISDIGDGENVKLLCSHDDSRIEFNFSVFPLYD